MKINTSKLILVLICSRCLGVVALLFEGKNGSKSSLLSKLNTSRESKLALKSAELRSNINPKQDYNKKTFLEERRRKQKSSEADPNELGHLDLIDELFANELEPALNESNSKVYVHDIDELLSLKKMSLKPAEQTKNIKNGKIVNESNDEPQQEDGIFDLATNALKRKRQKKLLEKGIVYDEESNGFVDPLGMPCYKSLSLLPCRRTVVPYKPADTIEEEKMRYRREKQNK